MSSLKRENEEFVYIFTLTADYDEDLSPKFLLDCFYECKAAGKLDKEFDINAVDEFFPGLSETEDAKKDVEILQQIQLRERFNNSGFGLLSVRTDVQLDRDSLEAVINYKQREGSLKDFLKSAKI